MWTHKEVDLALYAVGGLVLQVGDTENKEVDLALYAVDGLVLQVGDTENFPHALGFESLHSYKGCLLYTSPSPRDILVSRMPSSA